MLDNNINFVHDVHVGNNKVCTILLWEKVVPQNSEIKNGILLFQKLVKLYKPLESIK